MKAALILISNHCARRANLMNTTAVNGFTDFHSPAEFGHVGGKKNIDELKQYIVSTLFFCRVREAAYVHCCNASRASLS